MNENRIPFFFINKKIIMITDYFIKPKSNPIITEFYELHREFISKNQFKKVFQETQMSMTENSSRLSCVCLDNELQKDFTVYEHLPLVQWTTTINEIRQFILTNYCSTYSIDYGLVHYYHDDKSTISWHSDREALQSNIYSISLGGIRRFCLRDKITKQVFTFDLHDGDLFVMKIGCQDKYEHCIKSIKLLNQPRISITFRQMEPPFCYFTYYVSEKIVRVTTTKPFIDEYQQLWITKVSIVIGIVVSQCIFLDKKQNCNKNNNNNVSLLKSNLQKAIRRNQKEIALQSTSEMLLCGEELVLLRRLTIISIEDVHINPYYDIIVWYYVAISSLKYQLTNYDVNFILQYVEMLCDIDVFPYVTEQKQKEKEQIYYLNDIYHHSTCVALYLRLQYGGFVGEKNLIQRYISGLVNQTIDLVDYPFPSSSSFSSLNLYLPMENKEVIYLSCSIDFHCFPKMLEKVLLKIKQENESTSLQEKDIQQYIWHCDSNINYRRIEEKENEEIDWNVWYEIIQPKCQVYRSQIQKMLEIKMIEL